MSAEPTFSTWLKTEGAAQVRDDAARLLRSGDILDGWRVVSFIARGGNAEVYRVEHLELKTAAAVKISVAATAEACARFKQEAQILGGIRHEALPGFYAFGVRNGRAYLVIEFLQPLELPRTDRAVAEFALRVAAALDALHGRGIVHRDVKPGNVMTRNGRDPVIVDLGYAKRISGPAAEQQGVSLEQSRLVGLGTPGYAAPEQFTGEEISPASDIHALGVLLNECFDGKPPRPWKRIVAQCTSSLPSYRFRTAQALIRAIRRRNLRRTLLRTLFAALAIGLFAALVVVPFAMRRQAQEKVREEEHRRQEADFRRTQESLMREVQLIMDEKEEGL